jgi:hypothetical protein
MRAAEMAPGDRLVHHCGFCTAGADRDSSGHDTRFH